MSKIHSKQRREVKTVQVGDRAIGDGQPCFIIAEAGSNHNGNLEQAFRLIDVAVEAEADAVKFQNFRAKRMYLKSAGKSDYLKLDKSIYDIIKEMEMPGGWVPRLVSYCKEKGILFMSSVFDECSADLLAPYVEVFKIASYEMTHIPLVQHIARKGKPVIMSTGTASLNEVRDSVKAFYETGNEQLILLQCTASYPAPLESINISAINTLKDEFGLPVGISDHSRDPVVVPIAAVACGANVIEKHFTLSNRLPGPDHKYAIEPKELVNLVRCVREAEMALGTGDKVRQPVEEELYRFARRSIFAVRDIRVGETFTKENIAVLRNGKLEPGLPPSLYEQILGKQATHDIHAEQSIREGDLQ